jgi:hypothetical protein
MQLLSLEPKDIYAVIEISVMELKKIILCLDNAKIDFDGSAPEQKEAINYLTGTFYPNIIKIIEGVEGSL